MNALLEGAQGWTFQASPVRKTCATLKASKSTPIDELRTKETEVVVHAAHSPPGAASDWFKSPREVTFNCEEYRWDYQWTCQGRHDWRTPAQGKATVQLSADGKSLTYDGINGLANYTSDYDKSHTLDAKGETTSQVGSSSTFTARVAGNVLTASLSYSWTSEANWCGASTHVSFECTTTLVAK